MVKLKTVKEFCSEQSLLALKCKYENKLMWLSFKDCVWIHNNLTGDNKSLNGVESCLKFMVKHNINRLSELKLIIILHKNLNIIMEQKKRLNQKQ